MTPTELKAYFDINPSPNEVQWKEWVKIIDARGFIDNALAYISMVKGNYSNCQDYWNSTVMIRQVRFRAYNPQKAIKLDLFK